MVITRLIRYGWLYLTVTGWLPPGDKHECKIVHLSKRDIA